MIEDRESQLLLDQLKDDRSSLIVLYDSESMLTKRTKSTTRTSKFSLNFAFDSVLLQHTIYKSTFRSLMRRTKVPSGLEGIRENEEWIDPLSWKEKTDRIHVSRKIDQELKQEKLRLERELKVIVVGNGAATAMEAFSLAWPPRSREELLLYRSEIYEALIAELIDALKDISFQLPHQPATAHLGLLENSLQKSTEARMDLQHGLAPDLVEAIRICSHHIPPSSERAVHFR